MSWARFLAIFAAFTLMVLANQNCSGRFQAEQYQGTSSLPSPPPVPSPSPGGPSQYSGKNILPISVSSACGADGFNTPCVSVTICEPGTSQCVTVNNIILDTGSTGLRIYKTALAGLTLPQVNGPSNSTLAECYEYGDGTYGFWGPVQTADVQLGGETASSVNIQVVSAALAGRPSTCKIGAYTTPTEFVANGVMGVNQFVYDCGSACVTQADVGLYYSCTTSGCAATEVPSSNQVINPVMNLPFDNNGLIIQMPALSASGSVSITGTAYLGIGTQANNTPASPPEVVATDPMGLMSATVNGVSYAGASIVDSGTPVYLFSPTTNLPDCPAASGLSPFICPTATVNTSATILTDSGTPVTTVSFQVVSPLALDLNLLTAFNNLAWDNGATLGSANALFIWGLPFFYGRSIYIGIEAVQNRTTTLGAGPFVAF